MLSWGHILHSHEDKSVKTVWHETFMQVRKQQLELDMEQQTGSK